MFVILLVLYFFLILSDVVFAKYFFATYSLAIFCLENVVGYFSWYVLILISSSSGQLKLGGGNIADYSSEAVT